jgi:phosphoribosyl 1,2-cyclic phosphodiesterase
MGLRICSLSSGSAGNCIFVASEKTRLLIDSGIPLARVEKSLRVLDCPCGDVSVLVTHAHSDHICGVGALVRKYDAAVYSHYLCGGGGFGARRFCEFGDGDFYVGDLLVSPFRVSHDVPTVGFMIHGANGKISVLTDLGYLDDRTKERVADSDIIFIEANHDEDILRANDNYAYFLKKRILSRQGHLSNADCAAAVAYFAERGVKQVILGHLSRENNYPELAFNTVSNALADGGIEEGADVKIEVAPAERMSGLYGVV